MDRAIAVIAESGVKHEVTPLDDLMAVAQRAHRACFDAGAGQVVTLIKWESIVANISWHSKPTPHREQMRFSKECGTLDG